MKFKTKRVNESASEIACIYDEANDLYYDPNMGWTDRSNAWIVPLSMADHVYSKFKSGSWSLNSNQDPSNIKLVEVGHSDVLGKDLKVGDKIPNIGVITYIEDYGDGLKVTVLHNGENRYYNYDYYDNINVVNESINSRIYKGVRIKESISKRKINESNVDSLTRSISQTLDTGYYQIWPSDVHLSIKIDDLIPGTYDHYTPQRGGTGKVNVIYFTSRDQAENFIHAHSDRFHER